MVAGGVVEWLLGGTFGLSTTIHLALGGLLLAAGVAGALLFARAFARIGQDRNPNTPTNAIVSDGLYRFSRNPAYVSLTLIHASLALLFDAPWVLAALLPVLAVMQYGVIHREEAYLERTFGEQYLAYKRSVRRWV